MQALAALGWRTGTMPATKLAAQVRVPAHWCGQHSSSRARELGKEFHGPGGCRQADGGPEEVRTTNDVATMC